MITRVTQQTVQRSTLANLQLNLSAMSTLQAQMSSGKKISVPSDDPAGASDLLRLRGEQRVQTQYGRNADDATSWLSTVDATIQSSVSTMRSVRDLTVQGGDGALGATSRDALATQVSGLRDELIAQANTTYLNRSVFAGTSNAGVAYQADTTTGTYTFTGTPGSSVDRTIGAGTTVRVDSAGSSVYGADTPASAGPPATPATTSVFTMLDQLATALRTPGADATTFLTQIDDRMNQMQTELSSVGARENQVSDAKDSLQAQQLTTTTQISGVQDIDLADTILQLQSQQVAYQGALGAAKQVLQPSLLDYLK
jgi:flagellar hook-associated protein 3 FlgL